MALITFQLTDRQFDRLLAERRQEREIEAQRWVSLFTCLTALDSLINNSTERIITTMATQAERLQEAVNTLGTALDEEIAEVKAELEKLKADNPQIEGAINNVIAHTDRLRNIIVNEPVVESVTTATPPPTV